ncbi:hypothetical protein [Shewanella morhuae]
MIIVLGILAGIAASKFID